VTLSIMAKFYYAECLYAGLRYAECCQKSIYAQCHYDECYYTECHYVECYAECHYAEDYYAECHYAECHGTVTNSSLDFCTMAKIPSTEIGLGS